MLWVCESSRGGSAGVGADLQGRMGLDCRQALHRLLRGVQRLVLDSAVAHRPRLFACLGACRRGGR
eukprot:11523411-Alexandrium_andersonii.AAC.1